MRVIGSKHRLVKHSLSIPTGLRSNFLVLCALLVSCAGLTSCSHLPKRTQKEYVYVTAKETYLRDRVAAVSNRTATVTNGERLHVLEHGKRFLRVETDKQESGWIDEKAVVTQAIYNEFADLKAKHKKDVPVATATVHDEVNMHLTPGRDTEHFFRLAENDKLELLGRATLPRTQVKPTVTDPSMPEPEIPMEDWWLARNAKGDTGWLLSRMMDIEAPDELTRYAEGQRIVGAYVLTRVDDPDAPQEIKQVPEYVTVMGPYKAGLPYDFDQVRVFTWNRAKHRYETAYRDRNIVGFLPMQLGQGRDPYDKSPNALETMPTFSYKVLAADSPEVTPDPTTGEIAPKNTITKTYRLEGNLVRRILDPGTKAPQEAHPAAPEKKETKQKHKR